MTVNRLLLFAVPLLLLAFQIPAQEIDLLLVNGHVIDPKNNINARMDVAIAGGKVLRVAAEIPTTSARKVIDVKGLYVSPGFIDLHTHVFVGPDRGFANGSSSLSPDDFACRSGVTTVVDAGTSGWRNFPLFHEQVIARSKTRILAFLNIAGWGMKGKPESEDIRDMMPDAALGMIEKHPETIVGIKIGHYEGKDWAPFDLALEAAGKAGLPLFVECHLPAYSLEEQLNRMRPGDIITHSFERVSERMSVIDDNGNVRPFVQAAQKRGILFDLGHGGAGFWFSEAVPALKQGLPPNSFGTDMHRNSVNAGMKDMLNVMSKYLAMGMTLEDVILRATWLPARAIQREDLGSLTPGVVADIAVWNVRKGRFGYVDAGGNRISGNRKLEAELTLREGRIVWDLNGLAAKKFESDQ